MKILPVACFGLWAHAVAAAPAGGPAPVPPPAGKPAAATPAAPPAPPPAPVKPAPEITDLLKSVQGAWTCDGTKAGADGKPQKVKVALASKADLEGFWIHDSITIGPAKTPTLRAESFTTYDPALKHWRQLAVTSDGEQLVGSADTMKDMKLDLTFAAADPTGASSFREHFDASDLHKGLHATGEMSKDRGKTWQPVYDVVCRR